MGDGHRHRACDEATDALPHNVGILGIFRAPYLLQQCAVGEHLALVSDELKKHVVLMGG